ncbi:MAG TPA: SMP-30/gluconolactonase/LRE family protein [Pyrinomonadaceae bacterium]|nr:SMP-30/gluconolactonase/LRE family protein [Pyrinomonadaceae bacterium]
MKKFTIAFAVFACAFLTSCGVKKEGLVIMTDQSYKATMFATNKIGFGSPDGLLWHKGKLYFADEGGVALESWSRSEGLKKLVDAGFGFESPEDLVIDANDNIFFTDDDAGGLWEMTAEGKPRLVAGKDKGLISTEGIALAPDGSLLVGDGEVHKVFRVTRDGQVSEFLGAEYGITKPESMVYDDHGNLYIADNEDNVLYLLDPTQKLHRIIDRNNSFSPETIYFAKGSLYITDSRNNKLYVYTPGEELKTIAAFGGQLKNVQGVTVDEAGNIFVGVQVDLKHKVGDVIEISKEETQVAQR